MAKIPRKHQKIFAGSAANNGQFGSAQSGTKNLSSDLDVIQSLPAWASGWLAAVVSGQKLPALEEFQGIDFVLSTQLAYLFQEGIPEYSSLCEYQQNSIVKKAGTYELYGSQVDLNSGHALPSGVSDTYWKYLGSLDNLVAAGGSYKDAVVLTANTTLTAADAGKYFSIGANNITINLPAPSTMAKGMKFKITNPNYTGCTLATPSGDVLDITATGTFTSRSLDIKTDCEIVNVGTTRYHFSANMLTSNISANGWVKLASGLVIQWGYATINVSGTVTFPIAFPTNSFIVSGCHQGTSPAINFTLNLASLTQFNAYHNGSGSLGLYWHSFGN